ncbi:ABC transporter ATP-binding protein [candidate division KSB1 bacterium]|nr:ABC transporter ATP-binding protein [candidate division KSB1 bacterium]
MIELQNVGKNYGPIQALNDVSFSIKKGEIVGFVGPNGAGKSTAMKIITTYTMPSSGSVSVGGYDVVDNPLEVRRIIGYLPETAPLYADMLVYEYLQFVGRARHLNGNFRKQYDWVVEAAGLGSVLKRKIGELSKGFKQRTCLAQALIHDPDVLILDEPTSGLDPLQIIGIRKLVKDLAHEKTIILSTHILSEAAAISDRILMIHNGSIVADGKFEDLVKQVSDRNSIYVSAKLTKKEFESAVKSIDGIKNIIYDEALPRGVVGAHLVSDPKTDLTASVNEIIRKQKWDILSFAREQLSLEDAFIRLTQGGSQPEGGVK